MEPQAGALLRVTTNVAPAGRAAPAAADPPVTRPTDSVARCRRARPSSSSCCSITNQRWNSVTAGGLRQRLAVLPLIRRAEGVVMDAYRTGLVACVVVMAVTVAAAAQEGHPLVGSWHGDRGGATAKARTDVTLIMDYDGAQITGVVNPGFENMRLQNAKLISKDWTVHFELDAKDATGKTARCSVDGKIDRLGSDQRTLTGTWVCGTVKETFKLTRDRDYTR